VPLLTPISLILHGIGLNNVVHKYFLRAFNFELLECFIFYRISTPRKQGGLGPMSIPLLSDKNGEIAKAFGIYKVGFCIKIVLKSRACYLKVVIVHF